MINAISNCELEMDLSRSSMSFNNNLYVCLCERVHVKENWSFRSDTVDSLITDNNKFEQMQLNDDNGEILWFGGEVYCLFTISTVRPSSSLTICQIISDQFTYLRRLFLNFFWITQLLSIFLVNWVECTIQFVIQCIKKNMKIFTKICFWDIIIYDRDNLK